MVGRICPPGWNRIKVSENLGATPVAPVAPVDTSLSCINFFEIAIHFYYREASKTIYFNFPSQDSGVTFKFLQNLPTSKAVLTKISKNILSSPSACG